MFFNKKMSILRNTILFQENLVCFFFKDHKYVFHVFI
jgi:hypothetical protein